MIAHLLEKSEFISPPPPCALEEERAAGRGTSASVHPCVRPQKFFQEVNPHATFACQECEKWPEARGRSGSDSVLPLPALGFDFLFSRVKGQTHLYVSEHYRHCRCFLKYFAQNVQECRSEDLIFFFLFVSYVVQKKQQILVMYKGRRN